MVQNWQSDLIAAISVAFVALPLGLGIAIASGVPPFSGIIAAIVGGVVTTFYRGSHVGINGPSAGLIAVILSATIMLNDGTGNTLNYIFAAVVVSGVIQVILGLFKLGRYADLFHSTVIHGILAAIGVIIFAKQIHVALGTSSSSIEIIETLKQAVYKLPEANPIILLISISGLMLLIFQSKISYKLFHIIPAPVWVLAVSLPVVYYFHFFELHKVNFFGKLYEVGPAMLIQLPESLDNAIIHPNFSRMNSLPFWVTVISITLISSIESLVGSKAVDKLDPYKRKTNLNKDLIGIGLSTIVSGMIGGLPVITVIVRSTVNINNHAKTKWSNLYHGLILIIIVVLLAGFIPGMPQIIQRVPLAALAVLLVYTGYKLASPKVFKHVYGLGIEQLAIFTGTIIITLYTNLLMGIVGGLLLALFIHFLLAKLPITEFFRSIFKGESQVIMHKDDSYEIRIKGVANFLSTMKITKLFEEIPEQSNVLIDLSNTRLVDYSVMEHIYDFRRSHELNGGLVEITGLKYHIASSPDKLAMKVRIEKHRKANTRQLGLMEMAIERDWQIELKSNDNTRAYERFYFFQSKSIKRRFNHVTCGNEGIQWEICDLKFEEGAMLSAEQFKTTVGLIHFPYSIPKFTIEKRAFIDRYRISHRDIDYLLYDEFSPDFLVKVDNIEHMSTFLSVEIKSLIEGSGLTHLESDGNGILIFSDGLKLAQLKEFSAMVKFLDKMRTILSEVKPPTQSVSNLNTPHEQ